MSELSFVALTSESAEAYRAGKADANGQPPERHISDGTGIPCRHCLSDVAAGEPFLILAHRPFPAPQPYAETGPIFLHAAPCERYCPADGVPPMILGRERVLLRGYGADDRIVYGTGQVVPTRRIGEVATALLAHTGVEYVHLRSVSNNCYVCRIERST